MHGGRFAYEMLRAYLNMCKGHQGYMLRILKCAPREPPAKNVQTSSFKTCLHYPKGEGENKPKAEMGKKKALPP